MADFESIGKNAMGVIRNSVKKEPLSVISINSKGGGWEALVEVLERAAVPDTQNLIGIYRVMFDKGNKLSGYRRIEVRRKADTGAEELIEEKS
ncbi:MAG: gas vesicle protein [Nanoarchaeota archaeon]|nr:gas vesicle protein [Nanoarchaeota archaeon]